MARNPQDYVFHGLPSRCSQGERGFPCFHGNSTEYFHRDGDDNGRNHHAENDSAGQKTVTGGRMAKDVAQIPHERNNDKDVLESIDDGGNSCHDIDNQANQFPHMSMGIFREVNGTQETDWNG